MFINPKKEEMQSVVTFAGHHGSNEQAMERSKYQIIVLDTLYDNNN